MILKVIKVFLVGMGTLIAGGFLFVYLSVNWVSPFVERNPADPDFRLSQFKVGDYKQPDDLRNALKILLPAGTPRCRVEEILVVQGRAEASGVPEKHYDTLYYAADKKGRSSAGVKWETNFIADTLRWFLRQFMISIYIIQADYDEKDLLKSIDVRLGGGPGATIGLRMDAYPKPRICDNPASGQ